MNILEIITKFKKNKGKLILIIIIFNVSLYSDTIILKSEKVYKGKVISQDENSITIKDKNNKSNTFSKSDVLRVVYKDLDEKETKKIIEENKLPEKKKKKTITNDSNNSEGFENDEFKGFPGKHSLGFGGELFYGNFTSDWEERSKFLNLISGSIESDWENKMGGGGKLFLEYFRPLQFNRVNNYFFRFSNSRWNRDFNSSTLGTTGIVNNKYDVRLGLFQIESGIVLNLNKNFNVKPKFILNRVKQTIGFDYSGYGGVTGITSDYVYYTNATGNYSNISYSGTLGIDLEYKFNDDISLIGNLNLFSPFLIQTKGSHESSVETLGAYSFTTLGTNAFTYSIANGNGKYSHKLTGYSLGASKTLNSNLKIYFLLEKTTIETKIIAPTVFNFSVSEQNGIVSSSAGISSTIYQRLFWTSPENIEILGLKFGVLYEIDLDK